MRDLRLERVVGHFVLSPTFLPPLFSEKCYCVHLAILTQGPIQYYG